MSLHVYFAGKSTVALASNVALHLKFNEAIMRGSKPVGTFHSDFLPLHNNLQ